MKKKKNKQTKKKQKQNKNKKTEMILVTFVVTNSPVHTNPDIFKSVFIYIFYMNKPSVLFSVHT